MLKSYVVGHHPSLDGTIAYRGAVLTLAATYERILFIETQAFAQEIQDLISGFQWARVMKFANDEDARIAFRYGHGCKIFIDKVSGSDPLVLTFS